VNARRHHASHQRAKQNPLLRYIQESTESPQTTQEPFAPLLHPRAAAKMQNTFTRVPYDIIVYYGNESIEALMPVAKQNNAVVLRVVEAKKYPSDGVYYADPWQQRGQSTRTTPITPFTLLHRLGDRIQSFALENNALSDHIDTIDEILVEGKRALDCMWVAKMREKYPHAWDFPQSEQPDYRPLYQGINTAAGRMGVIAEWSQGLSELFAKFLVRGHIAYVKPVSPSDELNRYYEKMEAILPQAVAEMVKYIKPGKVYTLFYR
jgi:hypothetical protein